MAKLFLPMNIILACMALAMMTCFSVNAAPSWEYIEQKRSCKSKILGICTKWGSWGDKDTGSKKNCFQSGTDGKDTPPRYWSDDGYHRWKRVDGTRKDLPCMANFGGAERYDLGECGDWTIDGKLFGPTVYRYTCYPKGRNLQDKAGNSDESKMLDGKPKPEKPRGPHIRGNPADQMGTIDNE